MHGERHGKFVRYVLPSIRLLHEFNSSETQDTIAKAWKLVNF